MTVSELDAVLRRLRPQFRVVEGCYILLLGDLSEPSAEGIRQTLAILKGDVKRAEREMNRCFIFGFFDELGIEGANHCAPDELVIVADILAALIRDGLAQKFPGQQFQVQIVGGNLADIEPLEVCVTFSRGS